MAFDGEIIDFVESDLIEVTLTETEDFVNDETTVHVQIGLDTTGASEGDSITLVSGSPAWAPNPPPEVDLDDLNAQEVYSFYLAG